MLGSEWDICVPAPPLEAQLSPQKGWNNCQIQKGQLTTMKLLSDVNRAITQYELTVLVAFCTGPVQDEVRQNPNME